MVDAIAGSSRIARRRVVPLPAIAAVAILGILAVAFGVFLATRTGGSPLSVMSASTRSTLESAQAAYNSGDFAGAEADLAGLVSKDDDNLAARKALALALSAQGKNDDALAQYQAVIEADPADHEALYVMASLEQLIGETAQSITNLEAAIALEPAPEYYQSLAPIYATVGKWAECVATWEKYLEVGGLDETAQAQVHAAIASAHEGARDYEQARAALSQALFLDPNNEDYKSRLEAYGAE